MEETKKTEEKKNKTVKAVILFVAIFIAWISFVQYLSADKYEAFVRVVEEGGKIGVNPATEKLDYGDLPKNSASTRFVTVENNGSIDVYVKIVKFGKISELMKLNNNNFILKPNGKEKVEFILEMPISADEKEYKGNVIIFKLPKPF